MAESSYHIIDSLIEEYISANADKNIQEEALLKVTRSDIETEIEKDLSEDRNTIKRTKKEIKGFSEEIIQAYRTERTFEIEFLEYELDKKKELLQSQNLSLKEKEAVEKEIKKLQLDIDDENKKLNILDEMYYDLKYEDNDYDDQSPDQGSMTKRP